MKPKDIVLVKVPDHLSPPYNTFSTGWKKMARELDKRIVTLISKQEMGTGHNSIMGWNIKIPAVVFVARCCKWLPTEWLMNPTERTVVSITETTKIPCDCFDNDIRQLWNKGCQRKDIHN